MTTLVVTIWPCLIGGFDLFFWADLHRNFGSMDIQVNRTKRSSFLISSQFMVYVITTNTCMHIIIPQHRQIHKDKRETKYNAMITNHITVQYQKVQ